MSWWSGMARCFAAGTFLDVGPTSAIQRSFSAALSILSTRCTRSSRSDSITLFLNGLARARRARERIVPILSATGDRDGAIELSENEHHHGAHRIF